MKKVIILASALFLGSGLLMAQNATKPATKSKPAANQTKKKMTDSKFEINTTAERVSYALGINIGNSLKGQGFDSLDVKAIAQALNDVLKKSKSDWLISPDASNQILQEYMGNVQKSKGEKSIKEGQAFLEANKKRPGVYTLPSGLQYEIMKEGTGPMPKDTNTVTTHYHGTLIDGTVFDSSVQRGQPAQFPVNGVIAGWVEALQLMKVGSKWKLFVPSNLAYGERGAGGAIGPNAALIFEVELISIDK